MKHKYEVRRLDKFYTLAKTAGYRSRAAFKLIQMNKKYEFLSNARVCIDLCAAPGSWMQVAARYMPTSSIIIGVDRYKIAPIPKTIDIQGDITTEFVRQELKKKLRTWKADLVLHDGSPHVGQNWIHDAYEQNLLVLHAFNLACDFLRKDGVFVTKVFRSRDHVCLQYVFKNLFKKVEITKPIASRIESAEIYIICTGFLAPDKVDSKFFNPKHVFAPLKEDGKKKKSDLLTTKKVHPPKPMGYEEGITMLYHVGKISEFLESDKFIEILENSNKLEWDLPTAKESIHTTSEILTLVEDIKVLGRKDIMTLLKWRKAVKHELQLIKKEEKPQVEEKTEKTAVEIDVINEDEDMEELIKVQEQIAQLKALNTRMEKKKKKKIERKKRLMQERANLCPKVGNDAGPIEQSSLKLFSLDLLDKAKNLDDVLDKSANYDADSSSDEEFDGPQKVYYSRSSAPPLDNQGKYKVGPDDDDDDYVSPLDSDDDGLRMDKEDAKANKREKKVRFAAELAEIPVSDEEEEEADFDLAKPNPLVTDLAGDIKNERIMRSAESWFDNQMFQHIEDNDNLEDFELQKFIESCKQAGVDIVEKEDIIRMRERAKVKAMAGEKNLQLLSKPTKDPVVSLLNRDSLVETKLREVSDAPDDDDGDNVDVDMDSDVDNEPKMKVDREKKKAEKKLRMNPVEKAFATKMIKSLKAKRDLIDDGWNRHMYPDDEQLPAFFIKSERKFNSPRMEVDKHDLLMYRDREQPVDARTIKKVVEAKARKKKRANMRIKKARHLTENIVANPDMTEQEKASEVKRIYKKALKTKQPEKVYQVMKRSYCGRASKPKHVKGPMKMVDARMKKDKRAAETVNKKKRKSSKARKISRNSRPKAKK